MTCPTCKIKRDLIDFHCPYCGTLVDTKHNAILKPMILEDMYDVLSDLLEWEAYMGSFESPTWDRVRKLRDLLRED